MKKIIDILAFAFVLFVCVNCSDSTTPDAPGSPLSILLKNNSGHVIRIQTELVRREVPEKLILQDGDLYNLADSVVHPEAPTFFSQEEGGAGYMNILYDDRWFISNFSLSLSPDFNFFDLKAYRLTPPFNYVYEFTEADYEHTIRYGEDKTATWYARGLLNNQSGHTISIVHKPSCRTFPDSLVLLNGGTHWFEGNANSEFFYGEFDSQLIYYDGRYVMNIRDLPKGYRCYHRSEYVSQNVEAEGYFFPGFVYTFEDKDYDYVVTHGKDLGEKP